MAENLYRLEARVESRRGQELGARESREHPVRQRLRLPHQGGAVISASYGVRSPAWAYHSRGTRTLAAPGVDT
jgi:hypothetical protein